MDVNNQIIIYQSEDPYRGKIYRGDCMAFPATDGRALSDDSTQYRAAYPQHICGWRIG
jgi:hypothetical protein